MALLFKSRMYIQTPCEGRTVEQIDQWYEQELRGLDRFYANEKLRLDLHHDNLNAGLYAFMMVWMLFDTGASLQRQGCAFLVNAFFFLISAIAFIVKADRINRSPQPF